MSVDQEIARAICLMHIADATIRREFPQGSIQLLAWDRLKKNLDGWRDAYEGASDPAGALLRVRELRHEFNDVLALCSEAGFNVGEPVTE